MYSKITSIGTANPPHKRLQSDIVDILIAQFNLEPLQKKLLRSIYKSSGIETRYSVINEQSDGFFPNDPNANLPTTRERMALYQTHALPLALAAIDDCLTNLGRFDKTTITHLITVSCTGMYAPGIDIEIVQRLGLSSSTKRTTINFMGCYGAFNALKVADAFCKSSPKAVVLIVCVELCSLHFQKEFSLENMVSNAIFSDGAAAALVQMDTQQPTHFSIESFYCDLVPQTTQEMAWKIADYGFDIVLSAYVPEAIKHGIAAFADKVVNEARLSIDTVDYFAIHPGGLKILQACEEALSITSADNHYSYETLREFGNMSSATILFVLKKFCHHLTEKDNEKRLFSCAFGPGLTLESMVLKAHAAKG